MCEGYVGSIQDNSAPVLKYQTLTTHMITRIPKVKVSDSFQIIPTK